jgi:hypothetical protein
VDQKDYVRLSGEGISGSTIEAEILSGPASIASVNDVFPRKNGEPVTGKMFKEFNIKHSGKGMVKVKITVTPPKKDTTAKVTNYEYEVK